MPLEIRCMPLGAHVLIVSRQGMSKITRFGIILLTTELPSQPWTILCHGILSHNM